MIGGMLFVEGRLRLDSPMHIGSGQIGRSNDIKHKNSNTRPEVAMTSLDSKGKPIIPGSSLKGCLRHALSACTTDSRIFGATTGAEKLFSGLVTFWNATALSSSFDSSQNQPFSDADLVPDDGPFVSPPSKPDGTYVDVRTAIERGSGTADEHKLFRRQMVATGVKFNLRMGVSLTHGRKQAEQACYEVLQVLRDGISLGSESGMDQGRIRLVQGSQVIKLDDPANKIQTALDPEKLLTTTSNVKSAPDYVQMKLSCNSVFLINVASSKVARERAKQSNVKDKDRPPPLEGLHDFDPNSDLPRMTGATLKGKLRSAAVWYAKWTLGNVAHRDDPELVVSRNEIDTLSITERLFGVTGWRGLLVIRDLECLSHQGWKTMTSVKLDRFSGGHFDNGLFSTRASVAPVFNVSIGLETRTDELRSTKTIDEDEKFFKEFCKHLAEHGIELGMGRNRGLGWFDVEEVKA
jgi:CRISPR/Cas system CSM-associated protein Csm3 (group 7 of RAMP superfamily)